MKTTNKELVEFIIKARKRGFGDTTIKEALFNHGWPLTEIEKGFSAIAKKTTPKKKYKFKNQVVLFLDTETLELLEKRAKKNMFTLPEQIEDILRRSCLSQKKKTPSYYNEKLDDTLVGIFSRKRVGRKPKKKKKKAKKSKGKK